MKPIMKSRIMQVGSAAAASPRHSLRILHSAFCIALVASTAFAEPLTLTWDGGAAGDFSTGPWSGGTAGHETPQNGDTLVFGTPGGFRNDISNLSVAGLSVTAAGNVEIGGSQITLAGGASLSKSGSGTYTNNVPLVLGTAAGADGFRRGGLRLHD